MPYSKWKDINPALKGIKPKITLGQANVIAGWVDKIKGDDVESPWAVAIAQFKKVYKVEGGKWLKKAKEADMSDLAQTAMSAIEVGLALARGTGEVTREQAERALERWQGEIEAAAGGEGNASQVMTVSVGNERMPLEDLIAVYEEHKNEEQIDATDGEGMGEQGDEAVAVMTVKAPILSFAALKAQREAEDAAREVRELTYQFTDIVYDIMFRSIIPNRLEAFGAVCDEFIGLVTGLIQDAQSQEAEEVSSKVGETDLEEVSLTESLGLLADGSFPAGSAVIGQVIDFKEKASADEPGYIDLIPVSPGWGNKRDNHYYDLPVLRKYARVWEGAKMWATNHKQAEKNALNQVSEVVKSPMGYTEDGVPIARAVILNPEFEEMARRRKASNTLHRLHCSILATGKVRTEPFIKDGRKGSYVEVINEDNANIDWVTRAGAGGHAHALAEAYEEGGTIMVNENDQGKTEGTETEEVTIPVVEATLAEGEQEAGEVKPDETKPTEQAPQPLAEKEVEEALGKTNLPNAFKEALKAGRYEDAEQLQAAIEEAVADVKKITGSGQVFGQGGKQEAQPQKMSEEDYAKERDAILRRHGVNLMEVGDA